MDLMESISSGGDHEDVLRQIISHFQADSGTIHFLKDDGQLHLAAASEGIPPQVISAIKSIPVGKGMAGLAVERRQPVDACNIQTDQSGDVQPGAKATNVAGAVVVPIFLGEQVIGVLGIGNRTERSFSEAEVAELIQAGRKLAERG